VITADAVVVGAGPAGSAAAITLAQAGRDVLLVDKARFPRDKCCGDGLTTGAVRWLERLGIRPGQVGSWTPVEDVWIRSPSGRVGRYPLPREQGSYGAVARRADLDAALVEEARRAGAEVRDGHALAGADPSGAGRWTIDLEVEGLGTVRSRYAIGADGIWSPLRKHVGLTEAHAYRGEWHAFRQYFTGVTGPGARQLWVWFEPAILPGYAWSFPLAGGAVNVGFGVRRGQSFRGSDMARLWPEILALPHVRELLGPHAQPSATHRAWPIPARLAGSTLTGAGGRVLLAGDAARAGDPMTGEGIAQALETGVLAARAILAAGGLAPRRAASLYQRAVSAGLALDNRLAGVLSRTLRSPLGARGAVRATSANGWAAARFACWLYEDYPRALLATPWRWHRGALSRSGAWAGRSAT
jgi:geranylgeranyl reductase family protein